MAMPKGFRGRTLVLILITVSLLMVMHINFGALDYTGALESSHSSPVVWEQPKIRSDIIVSEPLQIHKNEQLKKPKIIKDGDCDRGIECDLYTDSHFTTLNHLPDIEHEFPQPPFTEPMTSLEHYKGLYRCDVNTGCPTYSAAFLTTKDQILSRTIGPVELGNKLTNMESASYHVFGKPGTSAVWTSVDAFDFSVEHISMYERVLKSTEMRSSPLKDAVLSAYGQRLSLMERDQRLRCSEGSEAKKWHTLRSSHSKLLGKKTVAVMPFYAVGAGSGHSIRDTKLKYLNITVHSIRCHIDAVVIAVSHELDRKYVLEESGLPIHDVIMLTDLPRPSSTGMYTVKQIQERLQSSPKWKEFEYIFYTEADQILHLRTTQIFAPFENPTNIANRHANIKLNTILSPVLVPHRFHSVPSSSDFKHIEKEFNKTNIYNAMIKSSSPERTLTQWVKEDKADPNSFLWYHPDLSKTTIRREMELYESRPLTRFHAVNELDSCCFLHQKDMSSKNHPSFITPKYYPSSSEQLRPQVHNTEVLAIGNGFAMVAGDCCFICTFKNRYCHNTCLPRRNDDSDCGMGSFTTEL